MLGIPFILQLLYILKEQILERFLQVTVASESCYGAVIRRFLILQQPAEYQILPAQLLYFTAGIYVSTHHPGSGAAAQLLYFTAGIYALHIGAHQYFK